MNGRPPLLPILLLAAAVCPAAADELRDSGYGDGSLVDPQGYSYFQQPDGTYLDAYGHAFSPNATGDYTDALGNVLETPDIPTLHNLEPGQSGGVRQDTADKVEYPDPMSSSTGDPGGNAFQAEPDDAVPGEHRDLQDFPAQERTGLAAPAGAASPDDPLGQGSEPELGLMYMQDAGSPYLDTDSPGERMDSARAAGGGALQAMDTLLPILDIGGDGGGSHQTRIGQFPAGIPGAAPDIDAPPTLEEAQRERIHDDKLGIFEPSTPLMPFRRAERIAP